MFNTRVHGQIVKIVREVDVVCESPAYILPTKISLRVLLSRHQVYTDDEISDLEGQKLTGNELLWKLLSMNECKPPFWQKNQPTIFQLINDILKVSTACPR
ncbi:hypothetical protein KBB68_00900 [Candidatus Babeliales bacterium]|nr:hypothetical protein [Candidatus Babeliales bacterium]